MQTTIAKTIEAITNHLNELSDSELVSIHNEYCQSCNYSDDEIFTNDEEFFNTFFDGKVLEAVRAVSYGDYSYQHEYVIFNGYGNLETFSSPTDHVDISAIAADILENEGNYYDIELEECFSIGDVNYEGTEEDAREQYYDYKGEIETENEELEEGEEKAEVLTFTDWATENLTEI